MKGDGMPDEELEQKLLAYFEAEEAELEVPPGLWRRLAGPWGAQERRRRWWTIPAWLPSLRPLSPAAASLALAVLVAGVSLLLASPWQGGPPASPGQDMAQMAGDPPETPPAGERDRALGVEITGGSTPAAAGDSSPVTATDSRQAEERIPFALESQATASPAPAVGGPRAGPAPGPHLSIEGRASKDTYTQGEPATLTVAIRNISEETQEIKDFPGTVTLDNVDILTDNGSSVTVREELGDEARSLGPGETAVAHIDVPGEVTNALAAGRYAMQVEVTFASGAVSGFGGGVVFTVLPPQGALETAVTVAETREAEGVAITLQRVQFFRDRAIVEALAVPSGYRPTDELGPLGAPHSSSARYRVDGGAWQEVGGGANRETPEGVHLEWTLPPVPADTATFEFSITGFGVNPGQRASGPWQWRLSLAGHQP